MAFTKKLGTPLSSDVASEDPDIEEFNNTDESGSEEEFGPTPIPSSSQTEQQQQPAAILPSSQQDDGGFQQTQHQSGDLSQEPRPDFSLHASQISEPMSQQEEGGGEELRLSQALLDLEEWKQKMDEGLAQRRAHMAELRDNGKRNLANEETTIGRLDMEQDSVVVNMRAEAFLGDQKHQQVVEADMEAKQDKIESHEKRKSPLEKEMIYKGWLDQIQEQKQQAEKKLEKRVGSQKEVEDRLTMLLELEQRIGRHLKEQRKKIDLVC